MDFQSKIGRKQMQTLIRKEEGLNSNREKREHGRLMRLRVVSRKSELLSSQSEFS